MHFGADTKRKSPISNLKSQNEECQKLKLTSKQTI